MRQKSSSQKIKIKNMKATFEIPYNRYALIGQIAQRAHSPGRTAVQKYLYLLQSALGTEQLYDFSMYTYGPFSSQILSDLDAAEALGAVQVARSDFGYSIKPGPEAERIQSLAKDFLDPIEKSLDKLFNDFGRFTAKELELRSTVIFAFQEAEKTGSAENDLAETVHEIKPGFTRAQIEDAIKELTQLGYVQHSKAA
jgi:uncharacterized protein YwgA